MMMQRELNNKEIENTNRLFSNKLFTIGLTILCGLILIPTNMFAQKEESASRGLQAGASYSISDIENVNNTNGNVMLNIPLASLPSGRGGMSYGISLNYNSKLFDTLEGNGLFIPPPGSTQTATTLEPSKDGGWRYAYKYKFEQKVRPQTSESEIFICNGPGDPIYEHISVYQFIMTFPDGSSRRFVPSKYYYQVSETIPEIKAGYFSVGINGEHRVYQDITVDNQWQRCDLQIQTATAGMYFHTEDGSNLRLFVAHDNDTDSKNNHWVMTMPDGTRVTQNETVGGQVKDQRIYDRNDNFVEIDETLNPQGAMTAVTATDQMNRSISITKGVGTNPDAITSTGFGGATLTWSVSWKSIGVKRDYKVDTKEERDDFNDPAGIGHPFTLVDEIILPTQVGNNQKYQFEYNGNPNGDQTTYSEGFGEVEKITLPSGAYAEYEYELDGMGSTVTSWQTAKHNPLTKKTLNYQTKYDGQTQTKTEVWNYNIGRSSSVITSPNGSIATAGYGDPYDNSPSFLDGKVVVTRTHNTETRIERYDPYSPQDLPSSYRELTLVEYTHIKDASDNYVLTVYKENEYDQNHNLLEVKEYDFVPYGPTYTNGKIDIPTSATVKRITKNTYYNPTAAVGSGQTSSGYDFRDVNAPRILNLIKSSEIQDGSGNAVSRTEFIYDNTETSPTKGNLTETRVWDSTKPAGLGSPDVNGFKLNTNNSIKSTVAYDTYGNPTVSTDAKGVQSQITYGAINGYSGLYPTETKTALGLAEERTATATYDFQTGLVIIAKDLDNNVESKTEYDDLGRPTKVIAAYNTANEIWSTTEYDLVNRRIISRSDLETKGDGKKVAIQHFDEMGRVRLARVIENIATEDPYNEEHGIKVHSRYEYDNPNPLSSDGVYTLTSNPYRAATSTAATNEETMGWSVSYSPKHGRFSESETFEGASLPAPFGSNTNSTGIVRTDIDANRTLVTDQAGKQRISKTNALGHLTDVWEVKTSDNDTEAITFPNNPSVTHAYKTSYSYDTLNNLLTVNQGQQQRDFTYSSLSHLLSATNPESGTISYEYDESGNMTKITDARGVETNYSYDNINRTIQRSYTNEPAGQVSTPTVTFTYDDTSIPYSKGKLTKVSSSISTNEYAEFDRVGRVISFKQITDGNVYETNYEYTFRGKIAEQKYPSGRVVKNVFNNDGEISLVQSRKDANHGYFNYAKNIKYNVIGAVKSMQLGNGSWESNAFNSRFQPTQIALGTTQNGVDKLKLNFDYNTNGNNNGNILQQTITVPTTGSTSGFEAIQSYTYDDLNRLKSAVEHIDGNSTASWHQTFNYDRYSNRNFDTNNSSTLTGCPSNECNPTIDRSNNRFMFGQGYVYDSSGNTITDSQGRIFTFDGNNKQVSVKDSTGNLIGEYKYDGDGNRVKKITNTEETIYVYDASKQPIAEYSTQIAQQPKVSYLTIDNLGSTRIVTDKDGNVYSRRDFMPFGEELNYTHTSERNVNLNYGLDEIDQKYTSYERDSETGLDFAQARMYINTLGRFTSVDPMMASGKSDDPQSWNRYSYVGNNPLAFVDTDGRLKRKKNGKIDFKKDGKPTYRYHEGDPNKVYLVQPGYVLADDGVTKIKVFKSLNKVSDVEKGKTGKFRTNQEADLDFKGTGNVTISNKRKDKNKTFRCDCHGLTFADGEYWIDNPEADKILTGDGYAKREGDSSPQIGDVAIYRDTNGNIVHSATVTSVENGQVVTVSGIGGIQSSSTTTAPDDAFDGITPQYYYDPDDTRAEEQKKENLERVKSYKKVD